MRKSYKKWSLRNSIYSWSMMARWSRKINTEKLKKWSKCDSRTALGCLRQEMFIITFYLKFLRVNIYNFEIMAWFLNRILIFAK